MVDDKFDCFIGFQLKDTYFRSIKHVQKFKSSIEESNDEVRPENNRPLGENRLIDAIIEDVQSSQSDRKMMEIDE